MKCLLITAVLFIQPLLANTDNALEELSEMCPGLELMRMSLQIKTDFVDNENELLWQQSLQSVSIDTSDGFVLSGSGERGELLSRTIRISLDADALGQASLDDEAIWVKAEITGGILPRFEREGKCNIYPWEEWRGGFSVACFFDAIDPELDGEHLQILYNARRK